MSNLNITDRDLLEMEKYSSPAADREPYHLVYARAYRGDGILNPRLPGCRREARQAAGQEGGSDDEGNP